MPKVINPVINKKKLNKAIYNRLNGKIPKDNVENVVSIAFEQMLQYLHEGNEIEIGNFCTIAMHKTKSRKYHHYHKREFLYSAGRKILQFRLDENFRNSIVDNLDVLKTFSKDLKK